MGQPHFWTGINRIWAGGVRVTHLSVISFFGLLVILWGVAIAHPAQSQTVDTLRQQQQQIEQQKQQINRQQDQIENLHDSAQERLGGLQQNIRATTTEIRENEAKLANANQQLRALEANLVKAEASYQQQQVATVARLRFLQRQQQDWGWAVLLQSRSLNEFLDRRYQLKRVYQADQLFLGTLKAESEQIERQRRQVERQKNDVAILTQELQYQKADFEAQAASQKAVIDRLQEDLSALDEAQAQLERDSSSIAVLIRQRIAAASNRRFLIRGTGIFSIPANGRISSGFGYRVHPILRTRRFHAGLDFAGPTGTPIRAADDGVVIFAGWYGGYGNTVIIDHGNDLTTLYGHASRLYVSEGQAVRRGEAIAAIGSTGLSTGPHLHFEVRRQGEPVDPLAFL